MEIREVSTPVEEGRTFRDSLKAWKNRGNEDESVESDEVLRAENEGMTRPEDAPEPVVVEEDALDNLEEDVVAFEAAEDEKQSKRSRR